MVWLWPSISMIEMTSFFPFRAFMIEFSEVVLGRMLPSPQITVILIKSSSPLYQLLFSLEYWLFELPAPRSDSVTRSLVPALDFEHLCLWGSHGIIFRFTHLLRTFSFLFVCSVVCVPVCSATQPCLTTCNPMNCSSPGSSAHGIIPARILEWADISSSRGSFWPRDQASISCIFCLGGWILYLWATWESTYAVVLP